LITKTFTQLNKGLAEGYGARFNTLTDKNTETVQKLQQNIYQFSGAKTYQQLSEYNSFLTDENGKERSFNDFKKLVLEQSPKYNKNYLQAEYQTAKASGQMAAKWEGFQRNKERYPYLRYRTVGDEQVRDDHRTLDGFTAHIDDKIWDRIYPPNDWRCRCYVVQTNQKPTDTTKPDLSFMKPEFNVNVGKTGVVFNNEAHPYYNIPKKDEKRMQLAFESMKLRLAYGKPKYTTNSGNNVYVHPFAKATTAYTNFEAGKALAQNLKRDVKVRPFIDTTILKDVTNSTYVINKKQASRNAPKNADFKKALDNAVNDKSSIAVIDLLNTDKTISDTKTAVSKLLTDSKTYETIKEVVIISKDRKTVETLKNE